MCRDVLKQRIQVSAASLVSAGRWVFRCVCVCVCMCYAVEAPSTYTGDISQVARWSSDGLVAVFCAMACSSVSVKAALRVDVLSSIMVELARSLALLTAVKTAAGTGDLNESGVRTSCRVLIFNLFCNRTQQSAVASEPFVGRTFADPSRCLGQTSAFCSTYQSTSAESERMRASGLYATARARSREVTSALQGHT